MKKWCLVGQPNAGKTTIFNEITNQKSPVGNWSGVTIDFNQSEAIELGQNCLVSITDLPGINSLNSDNEEIALDSKITLDYLYKQDFDGIINVVDALYLEKNLYLTSQLLELHKPILIVLNKIDLAKKRGITINIPKLSQLLNVPIIVKDDKLDIKQFEKLISTLEPVMPNTDIFSGELKQKISNLTKKITNNNLSNNFLAIRLLEGDTYASKIKIDINLQDELAMHDARYSWVNRLVIATQTKNKQQQEFLTAKIDNIVLHKFWGLPIFLFLIFTVFFTTLKFGQSLQNILTEILDQKILHPLGMTLHNKLAFVSFDKIWQGLSQGIITWLGLLPILGILYMWMVFLEASGYMARAAFLMDKIMRFFGLPGKAFVPMIIGFGCNVPAILASRTLVTKHERILACIMAPFMSCSARLTIYAVFIATFFPNNGYLILFALYFTGILLAILTGVLVKKLYLSKIKAPLIMELPAYIIPHFGTWVTLSGKRIYDFMRRSGLMIVAVSIIISILNAINWPSHSGHSVLYILGQWLTPIFTPMGITPDNWPASVGLLGGFLAKEVVIGTLAALYGELNTLNYQLALPLYFHSQIAAFAYLLFILLYVPCISTFSAMKQELGGRWVIFSVLWSLIIAYVVAVLFYQIATILWG